MQEMTKIKAITINGIRGIKESLIFELNQNSILLYGDNGSGKSSITDAFEWFYSNRIGHLSDEEIGRGGLEALRNIFLNDEDDADVNFEYTDENYNSIKRFFYKKESLQSEQSNQSEEFMDYLKESQKENLVLRYHELMDFVLASKKEKLDTLSDIIGFSEVTKTREVLRKIIGELKREFKKGNFDHQISAQQSRIIEQLGQMVNSDDQLLEALNELIKPLDIDKKINNINEIDAVLSLIKEKENSHLIELQVFYNKIIDWINNIPAVLTEIEELYKHYHDQFRKIISDIEKINKILLEKLLNEGVNLIKKNVVTEDNCPLCLQPKNRSELLKELEIRIEELEKYKKEKLRLNELNGLLQKETKGLFQKIGYFLSDKYTNTEENLELKGKIEGLKSGLEIYKTQLSLEISPGQQLKSPDHIRIDRENLKQITDLCNKKIEILKASKKDDLKFEAQSKILLSREAYFTIKKLKKDREGYERQQQSIRLIYSEFLKKQKEGLESFLTRFSSDINDLYQFMNPNERVEDIKMVSLEKDDELIGITMEFKFFKTPESPPHKYLSESHLNCLGIAFFLTSVKAFNKKNKFFILDDVISSFDTTHRKRFADLLIEQFSNYQIILMTHERNWFDLVQHLVKGKGWKANTIKWDIDKGAYIDEPIKELKEKIQAKIAAGKMDGLGNDIRKYLEQLLKKIAFKQHVKVEFRFNDKNENRMVNELLSALENHIKKKIPALKNHPIIQRLKSSALFIANKESHDSLFTTSPGDLKAFWKDVEEFEGLFF
jgi:energy-coupling factor transporter ATP-binding protein EcfA2